MSTSDRPACACHHLPMWKTGPGRLVCRVERADAKRKVKQDPAKRAAQREREAQAEAAKRKQRARAALLDPTDESKLRRGRKAAASRYAAAHGLNRAARGVILSTAPIERGPELPPLCACHHEPMIKDRSWRCRVSLRERERLWYAKQREENYEKAREKQRRSESRRRARIRGVLSEPYSRQEVFARDGGLCRYCDEKVGDDWHVAHLVALARGGEDTLDNVAVSCVACNLADGAGRLPVQLHLPRAA